VSALGWYATKHSVGLYATTPPASGFTRVDPARTQTTVDATPRRAVAGAYDGPADVEATAVIVDRDANPVVAVISAITPDGARVLANSAVAGVLTSMMQEPWEGRSVQLATDGTTNELRA
jgi:acetyl-CoA C-acetyltransferase